MLPFLKNKEAGAQAPVDSVKRTPDEGADQEFDALETAAEELISAVHSKDTKAVASALRSAFELCESQPHEEGPHE